MPLSPGTPIGSYSVIAAVGSGGMGEVYRARDRKLDRDVALKVLPHNVSDDAERLARLQREARTLAALNHPNIAQVYGLEDGEGLTAVVMEFVDGPTLADRLASGPLPLDEALPIARQIAEALEAAHDQGIIHRDLKPANVKVRPDGVVKVLDFGLARTMDAATPETDPSLLATVTSPAAMTGFGVILGTAAYMSPEQAKGKPVDRRADVWAFGVVLAEMLSGKRMFGGDTVAEMLGSVLKDEVVVPAAPPVIRHLLARCLDCDPRRRLRDIGEARIVLENPDSAEFIDRTASAVPGTTRSRVAWTVGVVVAAVAGVASGWLIRTPPATIEIPLRRFTLPVG